MATTEIDSLRFEVGLSSTPATALASISWTNVSGDVLLSRGVSFNRGRSSQDDAPSPGTLTLTLNNGQASGKNVGRWTLGGSNVTAGWGLRVPIRVRHTTHGVLWLGYVDALEAGWDDGVRPVVEVKASDRLARFARKTLPSLALGELLADSPVLLYPLNDTAGSTTAGEQSGVTGRPALVAEAIGTTGGVAEFGAEGPGGDSTAVDFAPVDTTNGLALVGRTSAVGSSTGGLTVEALIYANTAGGSEVALSAVQWDPACDLRFGFSGSALSVAHLSPTGNSTLVAGGSSLAGAWHHVAAKVSYSGGSYTLTAYVDGVSLGTDTDTGTIITPDRLIVGGRLTLSASATFDGRVANVAVYDSALSDARIAAHAAQALYDGDTATERWQRICRVAGLDAADYTVTGLRRLVPNTTSQTPEMGPQPTAGVSFLDALQACADVEGGTSFLARTGILTLQRGGARWNATVAASLAAKDVGTDTAVTYDTDRLVNDITVSRIGGATRRVIDQASIDAYDAHTKSWSLYASDDDQGVGLAEWTVYAQGDPTDPRIDSVTVDIVAKASSITEADLLTADVSSRIQLTGMPTPDGPSSTVDLFVEGIADRIGVGTWARTFTTSSATKSSNVFLVGDATYGVVTTGGVLP